MSLNGDKALIERLYAEGMNRRDPEAAANFYARDASNHGQRIGREGFARVFTSLALQAQTPENLRLAPTTSLARTYKGFRSRSEVLMVQRRRQYNHRCMGSYTAQPMVFPYAMVSSWETSS